MIPNRQPIFLGNHPNPFPVKSRCNLLISCDVLSLYARRPFSCSENLTRPNDARHVHGTPVNIAFLHFVHLLATPGHPLWPTRLQAQILCRSWFLAILPSAGSWTSAPPFDQHFTPVNIACLHPSHLFFRAAPEELWGRDSALRRNESKAHLGQASGLLALFSLFTPATHS